MFGLSKSRWTLLLLLVLGISLGQPAWSQPASAGIEASDGWAYFAEGNALWTLSPRGHVAKIAASKAKLHHPAGWEDTFLVVTEDEVQKAEPSGGKIHTSSLLKGQFTLTPWGDSLLALEAEGKSLHLLRKDSQSQLLEGEGTFDALTVVTNELLLFRKGDAFYTLSQSRPEKLELPFPADKAEVVVAGERPFFIHPEYKLFFQADTGQQHRLDYKPTHGLRALPGGEVLVAGHGFMALLDHNGFFRKLPDPKQMTRKTFQDAPAFVHGRALHFLSKGLGYYQIITYHSDNQIGYLNLPAGLKFHSAIPPRPNSPDRPLLFFSTELEEKKVSDDGKAVLDLETGKRAIKKVTGHQLYSYTRSERWEILEAKPRTRLIGPVERIEDQVVFATQTLPPNTLGTSREVNYKYPYPQVILRGLLVTDPVVRWSLEVPRGDSPSKARLPEKTWPKLGSSIAMTSEAGHLLSIAPASGKLDWASQELPLDEASPKMLLWPERMGLIAADGTTKKLILVSQKNGKVLGQDSLTATLDFGKVGHLTGVAVLCLALAYYIYAAGKRDLYIRKIAGLQALDEAVGRATEMGKPVLYVTGLADVDDIQTLAALSILSHVARKTAEYDTPIVATTSRAVTYSAAQEVVRDAFTIAGRPDAFNLESVRYISDDQFGYTAGVDGIMMREKPAANFYMGKFYAESLILAETGHATGAIQIAGTAQPSQLPFFVAACDYTLIGEELFAASAYLSKDPMQVGSLRGQDVGKAIVMVALLLGSLFVTLPDSVQAPFREFFSQLTQGGV